MVSGVNGVNGVNGPSANAAAFKAPVASVAPVAPVASMLRWCQSSVDLDVTLGPRLGKRGKRGKKTWGIFRWLEKPWKNHDEKDPNEPNEIVYANIMRR